MDAWSRPPRLFVSHWKWTPASWVKVSFLLFILGLLLALNNAAKGLSPVRLPMELEAAICIGTRRQRTLQSVAIWHPGNENRLDSLSCAHYHTINWNKAKTFYLLCSKHLNFSFEAAEKELSVENLWFFLHNGNILSLKDTLLFISRCIVHHNQNYFHFLYVWVAAELKMLYISAIKQTIYVLGSETNESRKIQVVILMFWVKLTL